MRILVVDDDTLNRFLLIHMLEQQGYMDTFEAEDGVQALKLAESVDPDLVLLDVVMPEMDGYETATRLKKMAGDIYLPIIFITALEDEGALAQCLEVGGDDFVAKPFDKVILAAKIRAHARTRLLSKKTHEQNKQLSYYRNSVEREHKIVEHIFGNALSVDSKHLSYVDFQLNPASDFNGDLFLINSSPAGGVYILLGDFTGHGLASAIGALPVAQAFRTMSNKGLSLMEMAETINETLLLLLPGDMFFAAVLVEIDAGGSKIDVWNGGMPSLILQNAEGATVRRFESRHMSLGILEQHEFESEVERYDGSYGDRLVGFSDGLVEVENAQGVMLGESTVEDWLIKHPKSKVCDVVNYMEEYRGEIERADDVTLFIYTFHELNGVANDDAISSLPVKITSNLTADHIKVTEPIIELVNLIVNQLGLYNIHSKLFTVLSELYNNALDHGILKLDSEMKKTDEGFYDYFSLREEKLKDLKDARISIMIRFHPKLAQLHIKVSDSGDGFDSENLLKLMDTEESYGRGIALVKELCHSVRYSEEGRVVDAFFDI